MGMDVQLHISSNGLPFISWFQQMTKGSQGRAMVKSFIVGGAVIATIGGVFTGGLTGLLWGPAIGAFGGMVAAGWSAPSEKDQAGRDALAAPVLEPVIGMAHVHHYPRGMMFSWEFETPQGQEIEYRIPLFDFDEFVVGSFSEWFGSPSDRNVFENSVIVVHSRTYGTLPVAIHAGPKADLVPLHQALTQNILLRRRDFLPTKANLTKPPPIKNGAPSNASDRINLPSNL